MAEKKSTNHDRLTRVIRGLQLLQRTNAPNSSIAKAAGKALGPLLAELTKLTEASAPLTGVSPQAQAAS